MKVWSPNTGELLHTKSDLESVRGIEWSPDGCLVAAGGGPRTVTVWNPSTWEPLWTRQGHSAYVFRTRWSPDQSVVASCSTDKTIAVWDSQTGQAVATLEGHTGRVGCVSFSADGDLLASKSEDGTVRLWETKTWTCVERIDERGVSRTFPGIAFHPESPVLATLGHNDSIVRVWNVKREPEARVSREDGLRHKIAKLVLLGDSGVGKTGLGSRLATGEFTEHASTHGQQFWVINELGTELDDGTQCEVVLWDLAGQPDYRLVHTLFLDDADVALILVDPADPGDPLRGAEYWLSTLAHRPGSRCRRILVGARMDRGGMTLTSAELDAFCRDHEIEGGYVETSALVGEGLDDLVSAVGAQIGWKEMAATTTTNTFKRIKDYVLKLKEDKATGRLLVTPEELRTLLEATDKDWHFDSATMMTAVEHLAKYGYVQILRTAEGQRRILLTPDLLNNLAASFVLEARRNAKGLGALEEQRVLQNDYKFPELTDLDADEIKVMLDSTAALFLSSNMCFRETLGNATLLIFPELINLKKPHSNAENATVDDYSYTVAGSTENIYATLVVLLGYTNVFTRTEQWQDQAQYEVDSGDICGFRQLEERESEIDLLIYYSQTVSPESRQLFRALFERFLSRQSVTVIRYPPVSCSNGHPQERSTVARRIRERKGFMYCDECGERITLPLESDGLALGHKEIRAVKDEDDLTTLRTKFETTLAMLKAFTIDRPSPSCFISYAWGSPGDEKWVEKRLASDLRNAGIDVILDRWHNSEVGTNIARFVSVIGAADRIIVVGTPLYRQKYENELSSDGSVVAAEVDLINVRLLGTEDKKRTVLPVLLDGDAETSLPPLMHPRVYADFLRDQDYFSALFDLLLTLYEVPFDDEAVADLRSTLRTDNFSDPED